jgi:alpha-mannosidase
MDRVLNLLATDPEYKHFMTDGQTVLLEDYLAARPDQRRLIARLVREERLLVGPWYVAPDEFLPSGESLIRNLQRGMKIARELGGVMSVGYSPDAFGHIAHLPAILRGLGMEYAVLWRGLGDEVRRSEFIWQSPDGSSVLTLHMPLGYGAFWPLPDDPEGIANMLSRVRRELEPRATTRYLAIMNGTDHAPPQRDLPARLEAVNAVFSDGAFVHGNLPQLMSAIKAEVESRHVRLSRYSGEMRNPKRAHLLPGAISARMWVKQRNQQCEDMLVDWLEPLTAWWSILRTRLGRAWREPPLPWGPYTGYPVNQASITGLAHEAWRQLLLNQSHDPIYGCGVDAVYVDVAQRFDSCDQIAGDLVKRMMADIANQVGLDGDPCVVVFNSRGGPRTDFVTFDWPVHGEGTVPLALVDAAGRRHECQVISMPPAHVPRFAPPRMAKIGFVAKGVPAHGYKAYRAVEGPLPSTESVEAGEKAIENESFAVSVDPDDGGVSVRDKKSGRTYFGLNRLVDGGDRGNEYNYWAPSPDTVVDRPAAPPKISVVERGPARWTLQIDMTYNLPAGIDADRVARARRRVKCEARCLVRLYAGVRRVDFRLEFDNQARDHRLRVHFPTGIQSDVTHAEQHFGVVTRQIALPEADETWWEQPEGTQPQKAFVDVNDGARGFLLANRGLPEYEALPRDDGVTPALTLLRCVGWLSRPEIATRRGPAGPTVETPEAQCIGRHVFEYAIVPHEGGWENALGEAHRFARPLRAIAATGSGGLPAASSLVEAQPSRLVVSAIKVAEGGGGIVVRVYNAGDRALRGRVRLNEPHKRVEFVNLNEERLSEATMKDGWVRVEARRNEIVSLSFQARLRR